MKSISIFLLAVFSAFSLFSQDEGIKQENFKSSHQIELEHYNSLGNSTADFYESIPNETKITREKGGCALNKIVYGWHPYWNSNTHQNYQWDLLSHLSFFSYEVNSADGQAISTHGWSTSAAVTAALANNTKVTLCVTLFSGHSTFFGNTTAQQTLITNLINLVQSRGAHGVNIDFEGLPSSQTTNFANFMVNLSNQMHAAIPGSEVSTVLYAVDWSNVFDFSIMEPEVDHYIIMGYDYYYSGSSTAGPTDPLYHFGSTYNYTLSRSITYYLDKGVPANKLVLGLPYYGWDYPTSGTTIPSTTTGAGSSRTYTTVRTNTSGNYSSANQSWQSDAVIDAFVYNSGGTRQCFNSMDSAFNKRLEHVLHTGIAGIGIWALGYDNGYTERWNGIEEYMTTCYNAPCSGVIHDFGGPIKNYYDKEDYTWTIQPEGAFSLDVNFTTFNVEEDWDFLYVYDGPTTASPQLTGSPFTGTVGPGTFTTSTGAVTFRFTSDISTTAPGFNATYTCNTIPAPEASFQTTSTLNICQSDSILLESTSTNAESFSWAVSEGVLSSNNSASTYLYPTTSGTYDVTLTVTNAQGTDSYTNGLMINVNPPPVASGSVNSVTFALPDAVAFFSNSSSNASEYLWIFGDGQSSSDFQPWHEYLSEGVYTVQLIAMNDFCENDTLDLVITVGEAGVFENELGGVLIYPNPAIDILILEFNTTFEGEIQVLDMNSRIVKQDNLAGSSSYELILNEISSGSYVLKIFGRETVNYYHFVKQ
jgi:spore germination protein YaaH/PKD repeat protein